MAKVVKKARNIIKFIKKNKGLCRKKLCKALKSALKHIFQGFQQSNQD